MLGRSVGGFRPFARAGAVASIALIGTLLSANAAFASTVIGSAAASNPTCGAGLDTVQLSWSSGTYAVPADGKITSWTTQTGPVTGAVGLQVWRPLGTVPQSYQLIGASPLETNLPQLALINIPLTNSITVQKGDLIGLRLEGRAYCQMPTSSATDVYGSLVVQTNPALGAIDTFGPNNLSSQLDVAATVDTTITPPPPPTSGCDSTGDSTGNDVCVQ